MTFVACLLSLVLPTAILLLGNAKAGEIIISCNNTNSITSNGNYTLKDCYNGSGFLELLPATNASFLENITICVSGGTVLPKLSTGSTPTVRNIHVFVTSVVVSFAILAVDSNHQISILDVTPTDSGGALTLSNISVDVENVSITLNVTANSSNSAARVAPLLFANGGAGVGSSAITGVRITVSNSNISVNVSIAHDAATSVVNVVSLLSIRLANNGQVGDIVIVVGNSNLALFMTSIEATLHGYQDTDPAMFRFDALFAQRTTSIKDIVFESSSSNFWMHAAIPGISNETAAVVYVHQFSMIQNVSVNLIKVFARVECVCGGNNCSGVGLFTSARVIVVQGATRISDISNQSIVARGCIFVLNTPKLALVFLWQYALFLTNVSVVATDCSYRATSTVLNVGGAVRSQSLVEISSNGNATAVLATIERCHIEFNIESGGCQTAVCSVVGFLDNISDSTVRVTNVSVMAFIVNGTAIVFPIAPFEAVFLTLLTTIVNIAMQDSSIINVGTNLGIIVSNGTIDAVHSTSFDASSATPLTILVSALSAVNVVRFMMRSHIHVEETHVRRSFLLPPPSLSSGLSIHFNATSVVSMFDYAAAVVSAGGDFERFLVAFLGFMPTISHDNTTVTVAQNCTVSYGLQTDTVASAAHFGASDYIALVILPTVSNTSFFTVQDSQYYLDSSMSVNSATSVIRGASAIASIGSARLTNSIVNVTNVSGLSLLMFVAIAPLVLEGITTELWFTNVNLRAILNPQSTQRYAIGSASTTTTTNIISIDVTLLSTKLTPFLHIALCTFENFTFLLMPSVINMSSSFALPQVRVLTLGCNLWDGGGMPSNVIIAEEENAPLLSHVEYPRSPFNKSIVCRGFVETATINLSETNSVTFSSSESYLAPKEVPVPPAVPPVAISTVTAAVGVVSAAVASSSATLDAQVLVALGRSVCAQQALHEATSASLFLLSPFYSLGDYAMVFGNLGLFLLFHAVHRILRRRAPSPVYTQRKQISVIQQNPDVAIQFPNHSITMAMLLAPGVVNGGVRGIFSGEVVDTIGGVVGFVAVSLGVWWRWRSGNLREVKLMRFVHWPHHLRRSFIAPWLLPYGQWGPLSLRLTHGRLRSAVRVGCEWLSAQTITVALLVQTVASIPVPTSWCVGLWFVLCGIQLVSVVVTVVVRPARAPVTDMLQVAGLITVVALEMIAGLWSTQAIEATDAEVPLSILSLLSMAVSFAKAFQSAVAFLWERNQNALIGGSDGNDHDNKLHGSTPRNSVSSVRASEGLRELISAICFVTTDKKKTTNRT